MRVLAVGNMYPPHHQGGYELIWRSAMRHLRDRGHETLVLTTDHREERVVEPDEPGVRRELRWWWRDHGWPAFTLRQRLSLERQNAGVMDRALADLRPDVVAWWSMGGMSLSLIERVRRRGIPAVAFVLDDWLVYGPDHDSWMRIWRRPLARALRRPVELAARVPTRFDPSASAAWLFISESTRTRAREMGGWELARTGIAHSGIDDRYLDPRPEHPWAWRLVHVGRVDMRKGLRTAVEALAQLPAEATLTLAGGGDAEVEERLRTRARELGVADRLRMLGPRSRDELPDVYAEADVLVFPVEWDEPWGLVPLEAMAIGRPVVATGRGGSGEYLCDEENCLLFPDKDPAALAAAVRRLADDPELRSRLREAGLRLAPRFTESAFNARVEEALRDAARGAGRSVPDLPLHDTSVALPAGADEALRADHPRLLELRAAYAAMGAPFDRPSRWSPERVGAFLDLRWFRGESLIMWHYREDAVTTERRFAALLDAVAASDDLGLLDRLEEDGLFGCWTHDVGGRLVSRDLLDSVNELNFLERRLDVSRRDGLRVLDVGAGYGRLAHRAAAALPGLAEWCCVDAVPESTFVCEYHLRFRGVCPPARVVPLHEAESLESGTFDLAVNVHSFSEMPRAAAEWWIDLLARLEVPDLVVVPNDADQLLSLEPDGSRHDLSRAFAAAGFEVAHAEPVIADRAAQERVGVNDRFLHLRRA